MRRLSTGLVFAGALILVGCDSGPVTITFPDFPEGAAVVQLGQRLTIEVTATNDKGKGVKWTCAGDACTPLTTTPASATFNASGITGKAVITATSLKQPAVSKSLRLTVNLNGIPDLLCELKKPDPLPGRAHS